MKKTYIIPKTLICWMNAERFIAGSQEVTSNNGMTYGGVDEDGELDQSVKQNHYNVWDDDWREKQEYAPHRNTPYYYIVRTSESLVCGLYDRTRTGANASLHNL